MFNRDPTADLRLDTLTNVRLDTLTNCGGDKEGPYNGFRVSRRRVWSRRDRNVGTSGRTDAAAFSTSWHAASTEAGAANVTTFDTETFHSTDQSGAPADHTTAATRGDCPVGK
jgi:hypothetical protein